MDVAYALNFLEYFSKLYIKSLIYAKLVVRIIDILTSWFCEDESVV